MKFKDLKRQYKNYSFEVFGRPLDTPTIPYTLLPKDKPLDDCEVVDYEVEDKEFVQYGVSFGTMKPLRPKKMKGHVRVYVK